MTTTLAAQLEPCKVPMATLEQHYRPMLELVRQLIGVVPNCDELLEMWPPGFRTYNLIVPNSLNLPTALWGRSVPKDLVGLGMYVSSRAAGCPYCTAHTCSFAMRRGATVDAIVGERTPAQAAVSDLAEALSQVPAYATADHVAQLRTHLNPGQVEAVAMGVVMMGFLNKFMDAVGVELEDAALLDVGGVLGPTGWSPGKHVDEGYQLPTELNVPDKDNALTYLQVIRRAPGAVRLERSWIKGVPNREPEIGRYLTERTGHDFPLVGKLPSRRLVRAIGTVVGDNLDPATSTVGVPAKVLAGIVFSTVVGNDYLVDEGRRLAETTLASAGVDQDVAGAAIDAAVDLGTSPVPADDAGMQGLLDSVAARLEGSGVEPAALVFARAAAPSPAEVNSAVLSVVTPQLSAPQAIEVTVWVSIQQYFHRYERFLAVA